MKNLVALLAIAMPAVAQEPFHRLVLFNFIILSINCSDILGTNDSRADK